MRVFCRIFLVGPPIDSREPRMLEAFPEADVDVGSNELRLLPIPSGADVVAEGGPANDELMDLAADAAVGRNRDDEDMVEVLPGI